MKKTLANRAVMELDFTLVSLCWKNCCV